MIDKLRAYWKTNTGRVVLVIGPILILCVLCGFIAVLSPSTPSTPVLSQEDILATAISVAQTTVAQTQVAGFTATPSLTQAPTETPLPTVTNTPPPQPITLTGSGDSIVDISKWNGPAIMHAKYGSGGNFAVINYGANNERIDLLINTIGAYDGIVAVDFLDDDNTTRFEVSASGPWEFTISPLETARTFDVPTTITGTGDDVVILLGGNIDLVKADNSQGDGNFAVWSYSARGTRDLIFNEISPYTGTALLDPDTFVLVITATNNWTLEVTTR